MRGVLWWGGKSVQNCEQNLIRLAVLDTRVWSERYIYFLLLASHSFKRVALLIFFTKFQCSETVRCTIEY
eukprot:m.59215 g.59215  ORF g.59215 m.59215 type:complete len:70 (-) comp15675_c0_seq5:3300-3509(-)